MTPRPLLVTIFLAVSATGLQPQPSQLSRRNWFSTTAAGVAVSVVGVPAAALAKEGRAANMYVNTDKNTADAALGGKADSWGDESRKNGLYASQQKALYGGVIPGSDSNGDAGELGKVDKKVLKARLDELNGSRTRLAAKVEPALSKGKWPAVVDACNSELYQFKSFLAATTKLAQGGKVCLIDATQRGMTMPRGMDPADCPLQQVQVAILQQINNVYVEASRKDCVAASASFAKFQASFDEFAVAAAAIAA